MRHAGSLLLSLFLAPLIWIATGYGLNEIGRARAQFAGGFHVEIVLGLAALVAGGALYAVLVLARLSPIGPALVGLGFLGLSTWAAFDPASYFDTMPANLRDNDLALTYPALGYSALLAVPLLGTLLSPRRWRRHAHATPAPYPMAGAPGMPPGAVPPGGPYAPPPSYAAPPGYPPPPFSGAPGSSQPRPNEPAPATAFPAAPFQAAPPTAPFPAAPPTSGAPAPSSGAPAPSSAPPAPVEAQTTRIPAQSPPPPAEHEATTRITERAPTSPAEAPTTHISAAGGDQTTVLSAPEAPAGDRTTHIPAPATPVGEETTRVSAPAAPVGEETTRVSAPPAPVGDQTTTRIGAPDTEATQLLKGPPPKDAYPRPAWSAPTPPPFTPPGARTDDDQDDPEATQPSR